MFLFLTVFLMFTDPLGYSIWIAKDQVVAVSRNIDGAPEAKTKITTSSSPIYVRETVDETVRKLEK